MVTCLDIIKDELKGELAGVLAEFKNQPEQLISLLYKEASMETSPTINFITAISAKLSQLDGEESKEENESHVNFITCDGEALAESTVDVDIGGNHDAASKIQGTLPSAQQTSPAEGTVTEPATEAGGDKEGVQYMSMVSVDNRRRPSQAAAGDGGGTSFTAANSNNSTPRRRGAAKRAATCREDQASLRSFQSRGQPIGHTTRERGGIFPNLTIWILKVW
jgi:hypothetical protein